MSRVEAFPCRIGRPISRATTGRRASLPTPFSSLFGLARREVWLLAALLAVALLMLAFVGIADRVGEGGTATLDERLLLGLRNPADRADPLGPAWLEEMARDVTAIGSTVVLTFLVVAIAGWLVLSAKRATAGLLLAASLGGMIIANLLKLAFDRPRPDLVPHATQVFTTSFPSAHATLAAVTFLTLGAILARTQQRRAVRAYLLGLAVLLTVLVGISRVYLGVHYPSDVAAGWCVGAAWAILCWTIDLRLQQRGSVEPPGEKK